METTPPSCDPWLGAGGQYEYRMLTLPMATTRAQVCQLLTEQAEYGRWELARSVTYWGGVKRVWLRRKAIKVHSTL